MYTSDDKKRVAKAVNDAQLVFWKEIAKQFPEITTGDFGCGETVQFELACREAVGLWVYLNKYRSGT